MQTKRSGETKMKKILIVEDDNDINNMLRDLLMQNRYLVKTAYSGTEALLCVKQEEFDLMLLDYMLPGMDGRQVLEEIKKIKTVPTIMLTAKDDITSKVELLTLGAEDYMTKPFHNEELLARMEVVLRRKKENKGTEKLRFKELELDKEKMEITVIGKMVSFTKREYLILELLMTQPEKVFTKSNIYESVWKEEYLGDENVINVHMSNLRQKLSEASGGKEYIKTIWGIGFKLNSET